MSAPDSLRSWALAAALCLPALASAQPEAASTPLTLGEPVSGMLEAPDERHAERSAYADRYRFHAEAGTLIRFDMTASFDTYLYLLDADGAVLAYDDDGGDGLNSRLVLSAPYTGEYQLLATSFSMAVGAYQLYSEGITDIPDVRVRGIARGERVEGRLDATSGMLLSSIHRAEALTFPARAGEALRLRVASELPVRVSLVSDQGEIAFGGDDGLPPRMGGTGMAAGLEEAAEQLLFIPRTGTWRFVISSPHQTAWALRVDDWAPGAWNPQRLSSGEPFTATLRADRGIDPLGRSSIHGALAVRAGQRVVASATCSSCTLQLAGPGFDGVEQYSNGLVVNASGIATADGDVVVTVSEYLDATYNPSVDVELRATASELREPSVQRIRLGSRVDGTIETTDAAALAGAGYVDVYRLELREGGLHTIELSGEGVHGYVAGPTGEVLSSFGAGSTGSIVWSGQLPVRGDYLIGVAGANPASYALTVAAAESGAGGALPELRLGGSVSGTFASGPSHANAYVGDMLHSYDHGASMLESEVELVVESPGVATLVVESPGDPVSMQILPVAGEAFLTGIQGSYLAGKGNVGLLPGRYRVHLSTWNALPGGSPRTWTLHASAVEDGDNPPVVFPLEAGSRVTGTLSELAPGAEGALSARVRFELPEGAGPGTIRYTSDGFGMLAASLFDVNGDTITPSSTSDDWSTLTWDTRRLRPGTYWVQLSSWSSEGHSSWGVSWQTNPAE